MRNRLEREDAAKPFPQGVRARHSGPEPRSQGSPRAQQHRDEQPRRAMPQATPGPAPARLLRCPRPAHWVSSAHPSPPPASRPRGRSPGAPHTAGPAHLAAAGENPRAGAAGSGYSGTSGQRAAAAPPAHRKEGRNGRDHLRGGGEELVMRLVASAGETVIKTRPNGDCLFYAFSQGS